MAALPLVCFPCIMVIFLLCRETLVSKVTEDVAVTQNVLIHCLTDAVNNFRLISDFHIRPFTIQQYEEKIGEYNSKYGAAAYVATNNAYLSPWLTTLLAGLYIIFGVFECEMFGGTVSLGAFISTLAVFKEVGAQIGGIYSELVEIQRTLGSLRRLCYFMNLPTDLEQKLQVTRQMRAAVEDKTARRRRATNGMVNGSMTKDTGVVVFDVDMLDIELVDVTFKFEGKEPLLQGLTTIFPQGKLYALVGAPRRGKACLLKLLGHVHVLDPDCGQVFVPTHLRVLHVSRDCSILNRSLVENIVLAGDVEKLGGIDRVNRICKLVGFSDHLISMLEDPLSFQEHVISVREQEEVDADHKPAPNWTSVLTHTDYARINLARALLMNPECLVMHMPFIVLNDDEAKELIELLKVHVSERGVCLPEESRILRRPRTVFFSSPSVTRCSQADVIYEC